MDLYLKGMRGCNAEYPKKRPIISVKISIAQVYKRVNKFTTATCVQILSCYTVNKLGFNLFCLFGQSKLSLYGHCLEMKHFQVHDTQRQVEQNTIFHCNVRLSLGYKKQNEQVKSSPGYHCAKHLDKQCPHAPSSVLSLNQTWFCQVEKNVNYVP